MTKEQFAERRAVLHEKRTQLLLRLGQVEGALATLDELEPDLLAEDKTPAPVEASESKEE